MRNCLEIRVKPGEKNEYPSTTYYGGARSLDTATQVRQGVDLSGLNIMLQKQASHCISFNFGSIGDPRLPPSNVGVSLQDWIGATSPSLAEGKIAPGGTYEICGVVPG